MIFTRNVSGMTEILKSKRVAVIGCGGLGSNCAVALVRAGTGNLILADFDVIEASNLNRQYYFLDDIGKNKVAVLKNHLLSINSECKITEVNKRITAEDFVSFADADLLIEAVDRAETKHMIIETWCRNYPEKFIICGSGLSGLGGTSAIKIRQSGKIVFCGDETTDMSLGLCSAKVAIVANMQANAALELLVTGKIS